MSDKYFIWCSERGQFWKGSRWGYTSDISDAGQFIEADALVIVNNANTVKIEEFLIPVAAINAVCFYLGLKEGEKNNGK